MHRRLLKWSYQLFYPKPWLRTEGNFKKNVSRKFIHVLEDSKFNNL